MSFRISVLYLAHYSIFSIFLFSWFTLFYFPSLLSDHYVLLFLFTLLLFLLLLFPNLNFQFWHSLIFHFLKTHAVFREIPYTFRSLSLSWWTSIHLFQLKTSPTYCIHSHIYNLLLDISEFLIYTLNWSTSSSKFTLYFFNLSTSSLNYFYQ